jgi:hypothetical protein
MQAESRPSPHPAGCTTIAISFQRKVIGVEKVQSCLRVGQLTWASLLTLVAVCPITPQTPQALSQFRGDIRAQRKPPSGRSEKRFRSRAAARR